MFETVFVALVVVALIFALIKNLAPPALVFLSALTLVLATGIITVEEAFSGFSSPVIFVIGSLFVIAKAIQNSVNTGKIVSRLLGGKFTSFGTIAKLTLPVAAASAITANTPVVASLIQPLENWSKKHRVSVSKLLIPLSYAAILGGTLTLIGTSTNLVVSGLLAEAGFDPFSMFEITKISLPVVITGLVTILIVLPRTLPSGKTVKKDTIKDSIIEYTASSEIDGKTVGNAGLRNLPKLYLASIVRKNGDLVAMVSPETVIRKGDTLQFVGDINSITSLQGFKGVSPKAQKHEKELVLKSAAVYEVVLGHDSKVIHRTLKETGFRSYYQAAVYAIHRSGEKLVGKLGEIKLKVGDTLLLVSDEYFEDRWSGKSDFLLINKRENTQRIHKQNFTKFAIIGMVILLLAIFTGLSYIAAILSIAILSVITGVVTVGEARKSLDFDLLIMIAASIGFSTAIVSSGLSEFIADGLASLFGGYGAQGLLLSIIVSAVILNGLVTNTAAASLLFPVALASATAVGADVRIFAIVLAIACSLSFLSPFGYQTNTMVFGPGGYKFTDYIKSGFAVVVVTSMTLFFVAASML